jgi:pentatricopeptide repeat protein
VRTAGSMLAGTLQFILFPIRALVDCNWLQVPAVPADGTACIRLGDVYSLVIDTYATQGEWAHALNILVDMHQREINAEHFMSAASIRNIYQQNGVEPPSYVSRHAESSSNAPQAPFGASHVAGVALLLPLCAAVQIVQMHKTRQELVHRSVPLG